VFLLSLRFITFGGRSAHLAHLVHKSGCKTEAFTFEGQNILDIGSLLWIKKGDRISHRRQKDLIAYEKMKKKHLDIL